MQTATVDIRFKLQYDNLQTSVMNENMNQENQMTLWEWRVLKGQWNSSRKLPDEVHRANKKRKKRKTKH